MLKKISVSDPVTVLAGVGEKRAAALLHLGIASVGDFLLHFPRGYQNRGNTVTLAEAVRRGNDGLPSSVLLTISFDANAKMIRRGMTIVHARAHETDAPESLLSAELTFFNQPYMREKLCCGQTVRVWGRFTTDGGRSRICRISSPIVEFYTDADALCKIVPVYPLSAGLTQNIITRLVDSALTACDIDALDILPQSSADAEGFPAITRAFEMIHHPTDVSEPEIARRRFAFAEIIVNSAALAVSGLRRPTSGAEAMDCGDLSPFLSALPFRLTDCQARAVADIKRDLALTRPMKRMLSGDVGSGKTAVAAGAAYIAVSCGRSCALMAPTEILARQHFADLAPLFSKLGYSTALLTGSMKKRERDEVLSRLAGAGEPIDLVIGTHALLSDGVVIDRLGLVITDEQHRFGVMQRASLEAKGRGVHTLVMSATPIPRTLTFVLHGDLDVSVLDELPPGRQPVATFALDSSYHDRLYGFIEKQAAAGHGTYIVCPTVEEKPPDSAENMADTLCDSEPELPLVAAVDYAKELAARLPDLRVGCVHGRMKGAERDEVMSKFAARELDVLVSTTVIEVGVNVPSATLMVVENAERFGLSQLHQLRGRVGRGSAKSYCILISDSKGERARERLETMCRNHNGYRIAEEDLRQRGPGDFFAVGGTVRQSGGGAVLSSLASDPTMIENAAAAARREVEGDPTLSLPTHARLKREVERRIGDSENIIN